MSTSALTITEQAVSLQTDIKGQLEAFFANLPELTVAVNMIDVLTVQAKAIKVTDGKSYTDATEQVQALNSSVEDIEDLYKPFADALYRAHRTVTGLRATNLAGATAEVKRLKFEREEFAREQERQRKEAALKAQQEATEREQARLVEEARQEAAKGNVAAAEAILVEATEVEVAPVVLPSTTPQIAGTSFRSQWDWTLVDINKLKPEFLTPKDKEIGAIVRSMHKTAETLVGIGAISVIERKIVVDR
jgi:hypothetical protein